MSAKREHEHKTFVEVRALHALDGSIKPLMFREDEGLSCIIDEIIDTREAPALRAGGQGIRYTCRVQDREILLFHDDQYWFIEATGNSANATPKEAQRPMCGRYYLATDDDKEDMREMIAELNRRYNGKEALAQMAHGEVFPTMTAPVIANNKNRKPTLFLMKWGFTHFQGSGVIINARSETVTEKPLFKQSFLERRCLIPASYYFEWAHQGAKKTKYKIRNEDDGLTYLAGIYRTEEGVTSPTFSILTCDAAPNLSHIHPRMPLMMPKEAMNDWLRIDADAFGLMRSARGAIRCRAEAV